ncbi:MAG: PDZ domain-containing protein [Synergistales bacterium]|nr:PDZ domain-containing protein [Synergistales bacterium]
MSIQDIIIQPDGEKIIYTNNFADQRVAIQLRLGSFSIASRITNVTDDILFISWERSAFIDVDGGSHRVVPGNPFPMARSVPDTMIPPQTSSELRIWPEGFWESPNKRKPILDYPYQTNWTGNIIGLKSKETSEYALFAKKYEDRTLGVVLCFNHPDDGDIYYHFNLKLDFAQGLETLQLSEGNLEGVSPAIVGLSFEKNKISDITAGSIAEEAGLTKGDCILEVNGKDFNTIEDLQGYIEERIFANRSVLLLFERDGKKDMATLKQ